MQILATKIINLPVAATEDQSKAGTVKEVLVNPENGCLLGFLIAAGGMFSGQKALSIVDVSEWDPKAIITRSSENLVNPEEIVRIKEVLDKKIILLGMKAKTESGKNLGAVEDFLIDTDTECVTKYYLKDLLGNKRVYPSSKVVAIDKMIIFKDDVTEIKSGTVDAQVA